MKTIVINTVDELMAYLIWENNQYQYDAHIQAYNWRMMTVGDDRCLPWGYRERFVVEV